MPGAPFDKDPEDEEVERVQNWADEKIMEGGTRYPGMTYEQGVSDVIRWLRGEADAPDQDE